MTNAKELEPNGHSLAEHGAPLVLSTSHPLVAEAEALSGISACEGDGIEASAQASFEKVVYQELGTPFKYRSVAVLIVHWADYLDDDLKCGAEVEELRMLFEQQFRFKLKMLTLDDKSKPQTQLNLEIMKLISDHDGDCRTNLLIVYYTGHGDHHSDEDGLHIRGVRREGGSRIGPAFKAKARWKEVESLLAGADADILTILDTCSAGSAVKGSSEDTRVYEVLAATGRKKPTSGPGPKSFTRAMIETLKEQLKISKDAPFTTFDLNQAIMRRRKNQSSQLFPRTGHSHRFVKLAPLTTIRAFRAPTLPRASFGLTLRFVFANSTMTGEQAERLAETLSRSVAHSDFAGSGLEAKAIEWVDFCPIAGGGSSGEELKLHKAVRNVQQLWRASTIWKARQQEGMQKRELERSEEANDVSYKRQRGEE